MRRFQAGSRAAAEASRCAGPAVDAPWPSSQRLDRALGQKLRDGGALDVDLDAVRDLDHRVLIAQLRDAADDAAGCNDLVALLQCREHRARLLGALLLRSDQ